MNTDKSKLCMGLFLASESVFFILLILAYVYYRGAISSGPNASNSLDPPVTLIYTLCLIASSGTLWIAERGLGKRRIGAFRIWLGVTVLLGAVFLFGQGREYAKLLAHNVTMGRNIFAATFFTLTGFHGLHVLVGVAALATLLGIAVSSSFGERETSAMGAIALYWHFVDVVWIVIFSIVYLTVWA